MRQDDAKLLLNVQEFREPKTIKTKWETVDLENDLPELP